MYSWLRNSPYGLEWDFYPGRAHPRFAPEPITVLGSGDEGFIWGKNGVNVPGPLYGEPGVSYCDDNDTGYLLNAYGSGYGGEGEGNQWAVGVDFKNGPTTVHSIDFGYASGSNAPTHNVTVKGFLGGVKLWEAGGGVEYGSPLSLGLPNAMVDRIEIVRTQNITPLFRQFSAGWYTMDNLSFDALGDRGDYEWTVSDGGMFSPVPEPGSMIALGAGALALIRKRRKA